MGVPTSEVGYTPAMPRREDHEVHKRTCGGIEKKNVWSTILLIISRSKLYYTASGIITNVGRSPVHRTATYKI